MARILIAEDNVDLRALLAESLAEVGHTVTQVGDGQAAIAALRAGSFDVVISDVLMPEVDGAEVMHALRGMSVRPRLIMISGGGRIDPANYLRMAKALGADEVLQKPFPPSRLTDLVGRLLAERPAARA